MSRDLTIEEVRQAALACLGKAKGAAHGYRGAEAALALAQVGAAYAAIYATDVERRRG